MFAPHHRLLPLITALFTATLIVSNILASKVFEVGPLTLSCGVLMFPMTYLFNDMLTEVYGYKISRRVIWSGLAAQIMVVALIQLALVIPGASVWNDQAAFEKAFGNMPRVVLASILAYFAGEFCNSYILAKAKVRTGGKRMAARFIASTALGEMVDSLIFFPVAFVGFFPLEVWGAMMVSEWLIKTLWEVFALPVSLPLVRWLKRFESEDYYDRKTDFNPFRF
ncbi:MAG: queuosine precursor transporter [Bdellovibrionales bacterium]